MTDLKQETDYEKQASDFLLKTNVSFSAKFLKYGKHFDEDKENRDVYEITLKRGNREFKFNFGQSIINSGFYYTKGKQKTDIDRSFKDYGKAVIIMKIKDNGFLNNGKSDIIHFPKEPTAYDVLTCLTKSEAGTFEDFCGDFGYDEDSIKAEKTYKAVLNEWQNVAMLWSDSEIEELQEIN